MRLIDTDELKYPNIAIFNMKLHGADVPMVRLADVQDLMPTVEAIPVEWLKRQHHQYMKCNDKLMCDAYAVVLGEWIGQQKEQEMK